MEMRYARSAQMWDICGPARGWKKNMGPGEDKNTCGIKIRDFPLKMKIKK
jgi:hypothetical protein